MAMIARRLPDAQQLLAVGREAHAIDRTRMRLRRMTRCRLQRRAGQRAHHAAVGDVPQLDRVVVAAGGQRLAVGTEARAEDRPLMALLELLLLVRLEGPYQV